MEQRQWDSLSICILVWFLTYSFSHWSWFLEILRTFSSIPTPVPLLATVSYGRGCSGNCKGANPHACCATDLLQLPRKRCFLQVLLKKSNSGHLSGLLFSSPRGKDEIYGNKAEYYNQKRFCVPVTIISYQQARSKKNTPHFSHLPLSFGNQILWCMNLIPNSNVWHFRQAIQIHQGLLVEDVTYQKLVPLVFFLKCYLTQPQ